MLHDHKYEEEQELIRESIPVKKIVMMTTAAFHQKK